MDKTIGTVFPRMEITIYLPALFEEVRLFETNSYQKKKAANTWKYGEGWDLLREICSYERDQPLLRDQPPNTIVVTIIITIDMK